MFTADGTRTSKLQIRRLGIDDTSEAYACEVRCQGGSVSNSYVSKIQSLSFPGEFYVIDNTLPSFSQLHMEGGNKVLGIP